MGSDGLIVHTAVCVECRLSIDSFWAFVRVQTATLWCKAVPVVCFACLCKVRCAFVFLGIVFSERKSKIPHFSGLNRSVMSM